MMERNQKEELKSKVEAIRRDVESLFEQARQDARRTWDEDKVKLQEKLGELEQLRRDVEGRLDRARSQAYQSWQEDSAEIRKKVEDLRGRLRGGLDHLTERAASILNRLVK